MTAAVTARLAELHAAGVPVVHATVVRAQSPTSARAGDEALVLSDGTIEGFVGGQCARESVRSVALEALRDGSSVLLRVLPDGDPSTHTDEGTRVVVNPCLSGGALEIFLEPLVPAALLHLVGPSPVADAVALLGRAAGFAITREGPVGATAVVVASLGGDEAGQIRAALDAGVGLIGLVASRRRGALVLDAMALSEDERARVRTPFGLPLGARTPAEIALSILAEIVRAQRLGGLVAPAGAQPTPPREVIDPVCGMTVVVQPGTPHLVVDGQELWFCGPGCRDRTVTGQ